MGEREAKERQTGGLGRTGERGRIGGPRRVGKWEANGRTGGRGAKERRTRGGWATDGQTSGRARGLKGPASRSPLHSLAPRLLVSLQSKFTGRLGVHWGPSWVYVIFFSPNSIFAIQAQHCCEVCARIVLALSRIVTQNLWKERTIQWFRRY